MKKLITLFMVLVMVCSLAACSKSTSTEDTADQTQTDATQTGTNDTASTGSSESTENAEPTKVPSAMDSLPADATPAQTIIADFTDKANSGEYATNEDLVNAMVATGYLEFDAAVMPVETGYLNGFSDEVTGFTDGVMFGPWIGSIPFIAYVFDADGVSAEELVETLKAQADLRWNVCTEADEMLATVVGNKVCFVMAPLSFEEEF